MPLIQGGIVEAKPGQQVGFRYLRLNGDSKKSAASGAHSDNPNTGEQRFTDNTNAISKTWAIKPKGDQ